MAVFFRPVPAYCNPVVTSWYGVPRENFYYIGAKYYAPKTLIDEDGNLWQWSGDLEERAFYLLWLNDMETANLEDDQIIKLWQEVV